MVSNLTFGVNIAFGRINKGKDFTFGDIQCVIVSDYLTQKTFSWLEGETPVILLANYSPSKIWHGSPVKSEIYEIPDEKSYTSPKYPIGVIRQRHLLDIFRQVFPSAQRRAIDCTGLRLLECACDNLSAYGDVRRATSIWDTVPSIKFLIEKKDDIVVALGNFSEYSNTSTILTFVGDNLYRIDGDVGKEIIVTHRVDFEKIKNIISSKTVFIVHGRNLSSARKVQRFIEKEFKPTSCTILKYLLGKSKTLIELLEENINVDAAVVVLTPDDEARLIGTHDKLQPRARQCNF
jgi:hypothetical protein